MRSAESIDLLSSSQSMSPWDWSCQNISNDNKTGDYAEVAARSRSEMGLIHTYLAYEHASFGNYTDMANVIS